MKKMSARILTLLLILGELVFPLQIFGGTGITAAAAENTDISFVSETAVPDNGAAAWPGPEAFNVLSFTEKDLAFPFGYAIAAENTPSMDEPLATASNSCGNNLTWSLAGGILTISGTGEMNDYIGSSAPWAADQYSISAVVVESGVTKIGAQAFADCANISSVTLPQTLSAIGEGAFYGCISLKSIALPPSIQNIPDGLFANCISLTEISMPGAVSVGTYAFQNTKPAIFTIGRTLTDIDSLAFFGAQVGSFSVEPGNSIFSVMDGVLFSDNGQTLFAYPGGKSGTSYIIPYTVKKVGAGAFISNAQLTQIIIPEGITELGESSFQNCTALTSVVIPDSVTSADDFTFYGCTALKSVKFGSGLKSTSYQMFRQCTSLTGIDFGSVLEKLYAHTFAYCSSLTEITLPPNIKEIGNGAFGECYSLKSFTSSSLSAIPYQAFLNDRSLVRLNLNEGLTTIYRYAFGNCPKLTAVTLPASVNFVASHAFDPTVSLTAKNPGLGAFGSNGLRTLEYFSLTGNYSYSHAYEVLNIVNQRRREAGAPDLVMDSSLLETAMQRAMESSVLFSHTRPDGSSCMDLNPLMYGENIAYGSSTPENVMISWMNSDGHRQNILNPGYTTIGIGCVAVDGVYYWAQCFGVGKNQTNCSSPADKTVIQPIQIATETFEEATTSSGIIWGELEKYTYTSSLILNPSSVSPGNQTQAVFYLKNPSLDVSHAIAPDFLIWSCSDTAVATVNNGMVTALNAGSAEISATMANGSYKASAPIRMAASVEDFVRRMYTVALNRPAEPEGLHDWTQRLQTFQTDGAGIAHGFIMSDEFANRGLNNSEYVDVLYRTFFDREADEGGRNTWLSCLSMGNSRLYVLAGFVNSAEFDGLCGSYNIVRGQLDASGEIAITPSIRDYVLRMYTKALGRDGEEAGVQDWSRRIASGTMSAEDVAKNFFLSEEFINKGLDNENYVETLYQTFMDRASDEAGKTDWVGRLNSGISREEVLEGFSRSSEFSEILKGFGL